MKNTLIGVLFAVMGAFWIIVFLSVFPTDVDKFVNLIGSAHSQPLLFIWQYPAPAFYFLFGIFTGGYWIYKGLKYVSKKQVKK